MCLKTMCLEEPYFVFPAVKSHTWELTKSKKRITLVTLYIAVTTLLVNS